MSNVSIFTQLAIPEGLEPSTCRLEVGCSIQLSYGTGATCVSMLGQTVNARCETKLRSAKYLGHVTLPETLVSGLLTCRCDQFTCVIGLGVFEYGFGVPDFDNIALLHDHNVV